MCDHKCLGNCFLVVPPFHRRCTSSPATEDRDGVTHRGDLAVTSAPGVPTQYFLIGTGMMGFVGFQWWYPATVVTLPSTLPHWSPNSLLMSFWLFHLYHLDWIVHGIHGIHLSSKSLSLLHSQQRQPGPSWWLDCLRDSVLVVKCSSRVILTLFISCVNTLQPFFTCFSKPVPDFTYFPGVIALILDLVLLPTYES